MRDGTAAVDMAVPTVLAAGAAYVPVDAEDPDERAATTRAEARVCAVIGGARNVLMLSRTSSLVRTRAPSPDDHAWIIFTAGKPKGVAVSHRSGGAARHRGARVPRRTSPSAPATGWFVASSRGIESELLGEVIDGLIE